MGMIIDSYRFATGNGLLNDLTSYYKCDANGAFPDAHGSNDGTINGATFTPSGKINGGYIYDGINDYILMNVNYIPSGVQSYIAFWIYPTDLSGGDTFSATNPRNILGQNSSGFAPFVRFLGTRIDAEVYNGSAFVGGRTDNVLTTDEWQFIEVLITPSAKVEICRNRTLVNNGVKDDTLPATWTNGNNDIGRRSVSTNRHYDGTLDEIGIWNDKNPTDAERDALYNSGSGLSYDDFTT